MLPSKNDTHKPWLKDEPPKKILAIRLQALGDTFIAVSYLQNLREQLPPGTRIDLLVRNEYKDIPSKLELFDNVYALKGGNRIRHQLLNLIPILVKLKFTNYDAVLDLQNNTVSNFTRKFLNPSCFVEFDRFSNQHAGIRTKQTINKANIVTVTENYGYSVKNKSIGKSILEKHGWKENQKLIVLNPAGAFENRNWPIENYIEVAKLVLNEYGPNVKFLILGIKKISENAEVLEKELNDNCINLVNKTSQSEAFSVLLHSDLVISEDGALLHMAYLSKINTIGIIGSSRSDWVNPKLPHTYFFTSDDLECGNCMLEKCKLPHTVCMERVSPKMVFDKAIQFLKSTTHA